MPSISQQPSNQPYPSISNQNPQAQAVEQNQETQNAQSAEQAQAAEHAQAADQEAGSESQDTSHTQNHRHTAFDPGEIHFDRSPAQTVKPESRSEAQQSAYDNMMQLRNKRIENQLNQLNEEQRRQMTQHLRQNSL